MRRTRLVLFAVFLPFFYFMGHSDIYGKAGPQPRKDVVTHMGAILCSHKFSAKEAWKASLYDGQIDGFFVTSDPFQKLDELDLWNRALSHATVSHSGGYAAGICHQNLGWIATMPSPLPSFLTPNDIALPEKALNDRCTNWDIAYANANGGRSREIPAHSLNKVFKNLEPGTISVTCQPKFPSWLGKKTWFFIPINQPSALEQNEFESTPLKRSQTPNISMTQHLLNWIQQVRLNAHLPPFIVHKTAESAANELLASNSIDHNKSLLTKIKNKHESHEISLIGENRVKGQLLEDITWMLWNSPKHRDLLLFSNQKGFEPIIGIGETTLADEHLFTIVVGERRTLDIAQGKGSVHLQKR